MKLKVTHLVLGLGKGGAETMLYNILKFQKDKNLKYKVISFGVSHHYEKEIEDLGVELINLNLTKHPVKSIYSAYTHIKDADIISSWMYHSNLFGYFLNLRGNRSKLIWNVRNSMMDKKSTKKGTMLVNKICSRLSKKVDVVAYNGERARKAHEDEGYNKEISRVLDNGCDLSKFKFYSDARGKIEKEFKLAPETTIVLSAARNNPVKDLKTFIRAFHKIKSEEMTAVALMCGSNVLESDTTLSKLISESGLKVGQDIFLLGNRDDLNMLMSAADLYILHSRAEAFPNTLIQAMACETLIVSTDVGDVSRILGDLSYVVKPGDYKEIAIKSQKILSMTHEEKISIGENNREVVLGKFDINEVVNSYEAMYKSVANK